jgi:uncharacterized phage protein (TIGR02216 family)
MRAGLHRLGLRPGEFWTLTPVELRLMLGLGPGQTPINRARLEELAAAYPDDRKDRSDGSGDVSR